MTECFHCGPPTPRGVDISVTIDGEPRPMCCHGCQTGAQAILDASHGDFYERRTIRPLARAEPVPESVFSAAACDNTDVQAIFVERNDEGARRVSLMVGGFTCSACAWLIEQRLREAPGDVDALTDFPDAFERLAIDGATIRILRRPLRADNLLDTIKVSTGAASDNGPGRPGAPNHGRVAL